MKRREFVIRIGGGLLAVPALLTFTACGGDDDDGGGDGNNDVDAATGGGSFTGGTDPDADNSFHTHQFTIQCSDLGSAPLSVTATGGGHTHTFELDATQLSTLAEGGTITFTTNDFHAHAWKVTGSC